MSRRERGLVQIAEEHWRREQAFYRFHLRQRKKQIEKRDYFREHPEELEEMMDEARKNV